MAGDMSLLDSSQNLTTEANSQFVVFGINEEFFAFDMSNVLEIIRVPETVKVPLAPECLLGLANLRGTVLPVLDLRASLELPKRDYDDSTRVVVTNYGCQFGLVVDRVDRVMEIGTDQIESSESVQTTINAEAIVGVIHDQCNRLIQILEVDKLLGTTLSMVSDKNEDKSSNNVIKNNKLKNKDNAEELDSNICQLVTFLVNDQEYAFNISAIKETVRMPKQIRSVPKANDYVLGITDLRGQILPLVSLRRLFFMSDTSDVSHQRILVINPDNKNGSSEHLLGLVVDEVKEVLRIPSNIMEEVPPLLKKGQNCGEVESICHLDNGKRLISTLSSKLLFEHPGVKAAMSTDVEDRDMLREQSGTESFKEDEEIQMVVFQLANQEYGVMIDVVQEITRVPEEMNHVPKTPKFIEGLINLRGTVLPVLDLRIRFELSQVQRNDRQRILVLNHSGIRTGYIVDSVSEVLRFPSSLVEDAPALSPDQTRIMGKIVNMRQVGRIIQVIEDDQLLNEQEKKELAKADNSKRLED